LVLEGGERMNKKVVVIAVALMTIAMLATPVMAEPTKGQKVTAEMYVLGFSQVPGEDYSIKVNEGGIQIERNLIVTYDPILLIIDGGAPLVGTVVSNVDIISNFDKKTAVGHMDAVMLFSTPEGGFRGEWQTYQEGMFTPDWTLSIHCVLQGFGAFEGQTLCLSRTGPYPGAPSTGYLLKP
jgi:hypothetical protein